MFPPPHTPIQAPLLPPFLDLQRQASYEQHRLERVPAGNGILPKPLQENGTPSYISFSHILGLKTRTLYLAWWNDQFLL